MFVMMTKKLKWLMMRSFNKFVIRLKNKKKKLKKQRKRKKTEMAIYIHLKFHELINKLLCLKL